MNFSNKKLIYKPQHISTDKELIEELANCLHRLIETTDHYHLHFGCINKAAMNYYKNKSIELLNQMKIKPNNTENDTTNNLSN